MNVKGPVKRVTVFFTLAKNKCGRKMTCYCQISTVWNTEIHMAMMGVNNQEQILCADLMAEWYIKDISIICVRKYRKKKTLAFNHTDRIWYIVILVCWHVLVPSHDVYGLFIWAEGVVWLTKLLTNTVQFHYNCSVVSSCWLGLSHFTRVISHDWKRHQWK